MLLNLDVIGQTFELEPFEYDWKDCALYALGIGAGTAQLDYVWEGSTDFKVYPSFAVIPTQPLVFEALRAINANFKKVLHGSQTIRVHRPLKSSGTLVSEGRITEVQDKGKSAIVIVETKTTDADGVPLFDTSWSIVCMGQGDFGGERGQSPALPPADEGAPITSVTTESTTPSQALLYRLSGDLNPLHVDPNLATKVGFPAPILHGLCTYGYAMRAVIDSLCGGDPAKLKEFTARFSQVVYPGDALTVQIAPSVIPKQYRLEVSVEDKVVLSGGLVEVS